MYRNLFHNCDGVAAIEFALILPVLIVIVGGLTDFPFAFSDEIQIAAGVADGAAYAFSQAQNVSGSAPTVSSSDVQSKVLASISLPNVQVTVSGPTLDCVSTNTTSTPPVATLTPATAGSTCGPSKNPPGTYMVIVASYLYTPIMPLYSELTSTTLTKSAVVRLY
jgi:Flp pilus assembly protein TadG